MMHIIFDNIIYSLQRSGGGSVYWSEIIKRFNDSIDEVIFYDHQDLKDNIFRRELKLHNIKQERRFPFILRRYLPFTEKITIKSIFHSSYYRISLSKRAINITTVHDFTTEYFGKGLSRKLHFWQKKFALIYSHGIVCISENTKKDMLKFHPYLKDKNIRVIYNGVSDDFFILTEKLLISEIHPMLADVNGKKLVLYIGHRTNYKNFDHAVEAFARLDSTQYHFVVVGEELNGHENLLIDTNLTSSNYTVLSGLNNTRLNKLYNYAYVLLYPSSYEGFGIPLIEAMKTGLPVIAYNTSSIPEVVGEAGIILKHHTPQAIFNALIQLEQNDYRQQIIQKGFIQAKKFSWQKTYEAYYEFYEELYASG